MVTVTEVLDMWKQIGRFIDSASLQTKSRLILDWMKELRDEVRK